MDLTNPPDKYWHCKVQLVGEKKYAVANDMTYAELDRLIVKSWRSGSPFTVEGVIVRGADAVRDIRISHTDQPKEVYAQRHNAEMRASNVADMATDRRMLPLSQGSDFTFDLLFSGVAQAAPEPDVAMVERLCRRLPQSARILGTRSRKDKRAFEVEDEYDVQDLLHAVLRAYFKYPVQEDPLPKVAGAKSSRADISIQDLGVLIEVKYARGPQDQRRIFEEHSQDLLLYAQWPHLKTLVLLIYNSSDLRDAEAFEKLSGKQEIAGRRFDVIVALA